MSDLPDRFQVPRTKVEAQDLAVYRGQWWEHRLFAGYLWQGKEALEWKWRDYVIGYVRPTGRELDAQEASAFLVSSLSDAQIYIGNIVRLLSPQAQEPAFGPPGTPGDPALIEHLAGRVIASYEEILDWAARIRGTTMPAEFKSISELSATFMDKPLRQIRDFIDHLVESIETIPELIRNAGGKQQVLNLSLVVTLDDSTVKDFGEELQRVKQAIAQRR